jgi:TolB protein
MDADGQNLTPLTDPNEAAVAPSFGPGASLYYASSKDYAPFVLMAFQPTAPQPVPLPFKGSIYGADFNKDGSQLAVAVAESGRSTIYVGKPGASVMAPVSNTALATRPVWSPSGKLAWVGGDPKQGSQRVYVEGKAVSPSGFAASAPTFCDTEDGVRLVYSVSVGGDRRDLVMSDEQGRNMVRLTQGQGSNTYPACSPDGRLLAFFSTRNQQPGMYMMSLKRFTTLQVTSKVGESLRWAALPPPPAAK